MKEELMDDFSEWCNASDLKEAKAIFKDRYLYDPDIYISDIIAC